MGNNIFTIGARIRSGNLRLAAKRQNLLSLLPDEVKAKIEVFADGGALHKAAVAGDVDEVRALVRAGGARVNHMRGYYCFTALHDAARKGQVDAMEVLVRELGADVNATDVVGKTALHYAAEEGHVGAIRFLVKELADVGTTDQFGATALHCATWRGHVEAMRVLVIELGADVNAAGRSLSRWTPLHYAAHDEEVEAMRVLVEELGANVHAREDCGRTPIDFDSTGTLATWLA